MGIGPSTKETSLHHFRDPLLSVVSADDDLDLMGIILVGTPDVSEDKLRVSTRAAVMAAAMRPDGIITSTDGWGNSDVDYCNMEITVAGTQKDADMEREFFRFLVQEGLPVRVESNRTDTGRRV